MKKHSTKQFTLIEMMVVMAIIAILAGILFPAVMAVKDKAKAKETQTLVASVSTAIMQFKGEYNYLPSPDTSTPGKDANSIPGGTSLSTEASWRKSQQSYSQGISARGTPLSRGTSSHLCISSYE